MSKDITTPNQEKIDQIEKYLSHNPEQKISDKGLYRISIKLPNSSNEDIYHIAGYMLVDWLADKQATTTRTQKMPQEK